MRNAVPDYQTTRPEVASTFRCHLDAGGISALPATSMPGGGDAWVRASEFGGGPGRDLSTALEMTTGGDDAWTRIGWERDPSFVRMTHEGCAVERGRAGCDGSLQGRSWAEILHLQA